MIWKTGPGAILAGLRSSAWVVAVLFTPYLGIRLLPDLKKHGTEHDPDAIYQTRIYRALRSVIELALRRRKTVVAATVFMFLASIAGFSLVQQQFFPTSTRPELFFEMRLPEGTAIGVTEATAKKAEQLIGNDPDVASYTTYVGAGAPPVQRQGAESIFPQTGTQILKDRVLKESVDSRSLDEGMRSVRLASPDPDQTKKQ